MSEFNEWYDDQELQCMSMQEAVEAAWYYQQAKVDELQGRIDKYDKLISEFISDLEKTDNENDGNIHDYWRGFGSCANSAKKILQKRIIDLKGNKDD